MDRFLGGQPDGPLTVDIIRSEATFGRLREDWNELLRNSTADCVFLTWEWLYTWWRHLAHGRLAIITARTGNRLIAVAPFLVCRRSTGLGFWRTREPLGTGEVGSDYLDIIVRRGCEPEARKALADVLATQDVTVEVPRLATSTAQWQAVADDLEGRGWRRMVRARSVCPYIQLRGQTWASYVQSLGSRHRGNVRRRLRQLAEAFTVELETVRSESQRAEALETLVSLHNRRWGRRGGSTAFHTRALLRFHDELTRLLLARGWLRLFVLRLDNHPAAVLYGFSYNCRFHFYQCAFDERFAKHSVGLVLQALSIDRAIGERVLEYDMLHGDEAYKFLWARQARDIANVELYPPGIRGWFHRESVSCTRGVRRMARWLVGPPTRVRSKSVTNVQDPAMASSAC